MQRVIEAVVVTALAVTGVLPARAESRASGGVVKILARITGTPRSGPAVASAETGGARVLNAGEQEDLALFVNDFDGALGAGQWPIPGWSGEHAWHLRVHALSVSAGVAKVEVAWRRYDGQSPAVAEADTQVISFRQGQRAVLAVARSHSPDSVLVNVLVEVEASYVGDPEYENTHVVHDVWLLHERGADRIRMRAGLMAVKVGETRAFHFEPISFEPFGPATPAASLRLAVEGTVATSIKPDGALSVEMKANRTLDCGAGTVGKGTGVKTLTLKPGETIAIELPPPSGFCTFPRGVKPTPAMPAGFQEVDGRVRVNLDEYFRGARTSLRLTVSRTVLQQPPPREYR